MQTVDVNPLPGSTVGSYPNAISMPDPGHVLVSIGRDNALAVYGYSGAHQPLSYEGLLPTDWYPVNAVYDAAIGKVVVTNDKGIGARGPESTIDKGPGTTPATGHNTYDDTGSITEFTMPEPGRARRLHPPGVREQRLGPAARHPPAEQLQRPRRSRSRPSSAARRRSSTCS